MSSPVEPWAIWLDYRLPHYDALADEAAATLVGSKTARVRTDFDGTHVRPSHITLTTLEAETPDPEATLATVTPHKPVGVVLHHQIVESLLAEHEQVPDPRAGEFAQRLSELHDELERLSGLVSDSRVSPRARESRHARFASAAADLEAQVRAVVTEGLEKRLGMFLVPAMVIFGRDLHDRQAYEYLLRTVGWLRLAQGLELREWRPEGIAVCRACSLVFRPKRRATAEFCSRLCRARTAAPAFGEQPLQPGMQPIRVPRLHPGTHVVTGWHTKWVGVCPGCGKPFAGRRDAKACTECSPRLRQQSYRQRKAAGEEPSGGGQPE